MTMNSVFTTLTVFGSVFPLFLADLGLDKARIGLALALIPYATVISPIMAPFVSKWGFRRTFLTVWTIRKFIITAMLLAPAILATAGPDAAFAWVTVCITGFALCRATGNTGLLPWTQELVSNDIRGKFLAFENLVGTIGQIAVVALAGILVDQLSGSSRYTLPMGIGAAGGLIGVMICALNQQEDTDLSVGNTRRFAAVQQWNSWFDGLVFIRDAANRPLQNLLYSIVMQGGSDAEAVWGAIGQVSNLTPRGLAGAMLLFAALPILIVYPYIQRYFNAGLTLGAIKQ
ncbi:MAG: MFS transporter [Candidatus Roseilinea sp.]|uniref:MFS transporter n=1 Tax=Candidatus Roseilinea sp. TaxID=2838777 RepID=UPI004049C41F